VFLVIRPETQVLETGTAERRIVRLADGSQLSLDAGSRVEVRFARHRRDLRLSSGRARFDVAKDPLRPFDVAVGDKIVVALGTSFSVELLQHQLRVVLYEGRVQVLQGPSDSSGQSAEGRELTPGHEFWSTVGRQDDKVMEADVPRSVSWESGQLSFVNEPLGLAVERVNRYSQTKLVVADAAAAATRVNGVFNAGDINACVEGIKSFGSVNVTEASGRLLISGQPVEKK
jgi:transmembrane sensor